MCILVGKVRKREEGSLLTAKKARDGSYGVQVSNIGLDGPFGGSVDSRCSRGQFRSGWKAANGARSVE